MLEEIILLNELKRCAAEFPAFRLLHFAAADLSQKMHAVADAQHRYARVEQLPVRARRGGTPCPAAACPAPPCPGSRPPIAARCATSISPSLGLQNYFAPAALAGPSPLLFIGPESGEEVLAFSEANLLAWRQTGASGLPWWRKGISSRHAGSATSP